MSAFKHAPITESKKKQIEDERAKALMRLEGFKKEKISLQHDIFFVPGWTDEKARCWLERYRNGYTTMDEQIKMVTLNPEKAHFVTFTEPGESEKCESFLDFAENLKNKIAKKVGLNTEIDLVGHSMGGLDIVAAITQEPNPLLNVKRCITVATPHLGSDLGGLQDILKDLLKKAAHLAIQGKNLDPQEKPIITLNKLETRKTLLNRVEKLYTFIGTKDTPTFGVARLRKDGLESTFYTEKVIDFPPIEGACHTTEHGLSVQGITQDYRTIVNILDILSGASIDIEQGNYGYIFRA